MLSSLNSDLIKNRTLANSNPPDVKDKKNPQDSNNNKAKLAIPPVLGLGLGVISSSIYSSKKNDELTKSLENFKVGLELGFNSSTLVKSINSEITAQTDKIKTTEKENADILTAIDNIKKHISYSEKDKTDLINAEQKVYNANKDIIETSKNKIAELKSTLEKSYKKVVEDQLANKKTELESITHSQIKKFKIAAIAGFIALGTVISFVINKIQNKKEQK